MLQMANLPAMQRQAMAAQMEMLANNPAMLKMIVAQARMADPEDLLKGMAGPFPFVAWPSDGFRADVPPVRCVLSVCSREWTAASVV